MLSSSLQSTHRTVKSGKRAEEHFRNLTAAASPLFSSRTENPRQMRCCHIKILHLVCARLFPCAMSTSSSSLYVFHKGNFLLSMRKISHRHRRLSHVHHVQGEELMLEMLAAFILSVIVFFGKNEISSQHKCWARTHEFARARITNVCYFRK